MPLVSGPKESFPLASGWAPPTARTEYPPLAAALRQSHIPSIISISLRVVPSTHAVTAPQEKFASHPDSVPGHDSEDPCYFLDQSSHNSSTAISIRSAIDGVCCYEMGISIGPPSCIFLRLSVLRLRTPPPPSPSSPTSHRDKE